MRTRTEAGFTLVELMTVVAILGTVLAIALPRLEKAKIQARATAVLADVRVLQSAVANYEADGKPMGCAATVTSGAGTTPAGTQVTACHPTMDELAPYLPPGFLRPGTVGIAVEGGVREVQGVQITYTVSAPGVASFGGTSVVAGKSGAGHPQLAFEANTLDEMFVLRALRPQLSGGEFVGGFTERNPRTSPNARYQQVENALALAKSQMATAPPAAATRLQGQITRLQSMLSSTPRTTTTPAYSTFTYRIDL